MIDSKLWNVFEEQFNNKDSEIRNYLEENDECIFIPELKDFIQIYENIDLMGGDSKRSRTSIKSYE